MQTLTGRGEGGSCHGQHAPHPRMASDSSTLFPPSTQTRHLNSYPQPSAPSSPTPTSPPPRPAAVLQALLSKGPLTTLPTRPALLHFPFSVKPAHSPPEVPKSRGRVRWGQALRVSKPGPGSKPACPQEPNRSSGEPMGALSSVPCLLACLHLSPLYGNLKRSHPPCLHPE